VLEEHVVCKLAALAVPFEGKRLGTWPLGTKRAPRDGGACHCPGNTSSWLVTPEG